jgi:crossover junction endodeoxyribonuclease RuvC
VIILGIDPGTAMLGYGVVQRSGPTLRALDYGVISTPADLPLPQRLAAIHGAVCDVIARAGPDLVGVERLYFSRNAQTAFAVGQARGVVLLAAAENGVEVREATPNEVKVATAGHGSAAKAEVQRMVQVVLGLAELPAPDDVADALAIAICVANRERAAGQATTGALDRSAASPAPTGLTPFEKAVREALRAEKPADTSRSSGAVAAARHKTAS